MVNIEASCVLPLHRFHKGSRAGICLCVLLAEQLPKAVRFSVNLKGKLVPTIAVHQFLSFIRVVLLHKTLPRPAPTTDCEFFFLDYAIAHNDNLKK